MRFVVIALVTSLLLAGCSATPRTDAGADDVEPLPSIEDKGVDAAPPATNDAPQNEAEPAGSEPANATADEGTATEASTEDIPAVEPVMDSCQFRFQSHLPHDECVTQGAGEEYTWLTISISADGQRPLFQHAVLRVWDTEGTMVHEAGINPDMSGGLVVGLEKNLTSYKITLFSYGRGADTDIDLVVYQASEPLWEKIGTWNGGDWAFECKASTQGYAGRNVVALYGAPCRPPMPDGAFTAVTVEALGVVIDGAQVELSVRVRDAAALGGTSFPVDENGIGSKMILSDELNLESILVEPGGGYWAGSILYDLRITFHAA